MYDCETEEKQKIDDGISEIIIPKDARLSYSYDKYGRLSYSWGLDMMF